MKAKDFIKKHKNETGIVMVVLGVLIIACEFIANAHNNVLLFAGLFFVLAGTITHICIECKKSRY